ncbi:MAG TPA: hypothetical protein DCL81_00910, partial [Algoriphagus sp.]|nr:hypothetical protein [Algoriphagus sp.]
IAEQEGKKTTKISEGLKDKFNYLLKGFHRRKFVPLWDKIHLEILGKRYTFLHFHMLLFSLHSVGWGKPRSLMTMQLHLELTFS